MKAVVYLDILDKDKIDDLLKELSFHKPILDFVRRKYAKVLIYDFDNASEKLIVDYASLLIEDTTSFVLFVNIAENANPQGILSFFNKVIKNKEKLSLFMNGSDSIIEKMLFRLDSSQIYRDLSIEEQEKFIDRWIKS